MSLTHRLDIVTTAQLRDLRDRVAAEGLMRARCMVVPVDAQTALCRVLGRYKMYVDLRDTGFVPHLMFEGYWEYWLTDFMWRNVRPGQVALDLGANHGYYTILLADLVGAEGAVHAFEPNPRLAELLRLNVSVNGFWHVARVHAAAVADRAGVLPFLVPLRDPKNACLVEPGQAARELDPALFARHEVPALTLDEAVPGRADFVKIDVEGAEEAVWRGMQRLIARSPGIGILMEFNPHRCRDPRAILAEMAARFPLREVGFDGLAVPCDPAQVLERREDTILYLSEDDPA
ncbi:FkbM family methyltransferase [Crenalkalicoccus roseus]|uniref:FkbM family methyltransferase n=1 Tax=Crenalkalicoccus roseus TaxID=1485588 RepID=UPI001081EB41|nr:FkbM family methyltransferase [Crenalkalicoccus roseus]